MASRERIQFFDREQDVAVIERRLPHWSQAGTVVFLTWRTWDSIPDEVRANWVRDRDEWLARHGISSADKSWKRRVAELDSRLILEFREVIANRWNGLLDKSYGSCVLQNPKLANEVASSLHHFDGQRYILTDYVVMPNHVHILVAFDDESQMLTQCDSWKHYTAAQLNRALGRTGRFWQQDGFDHLVRSPEQFDYLRRYIAENPRKAGLRDGEFLTYSARLD